MKNWRIPVLVLTLAMFLAAPISAVAGDPHGELLTTYVNEYALSAIQGKKGTMAAESIVVKENYKPDKTLAGITVMYKVAGFDPAGGDWFWVKYAPDGKVLAEGTPKGCVSCHGQKKDNDWLYTGTLR